MQNATHAFSERDFETTLFSTYNRQSDI